MIKIIEPGTRTITKCTECGCKFSYEEEDIKNGSRDWQKRMEDIKQTGNYIVPLPERKRCIECPQCHKEIVLTVTR